MGMRFVAAIWRLAIAILCFVSTMHAWSQLNYWVYFTYQMGFVLGLVMAWAGAASLLNGVQPPAWLKGCLTTYAVITALVAYFILPPDDPATATMVWGIMTNTMLHRIAPAMAVLDFVLFDRHRRFAWHVPVTWLSYFPIYLGFVIIRAQWWPHSGPRANGNPYPYGFIDVNELGWMQLAVNAAQLAAVFFGVGLAVFLIDRILPAKVLL